MNNRCKRAACIIRFATVPPVMAVILIALNAINNTAFTSTGDVIAAVFFLAFVPVAAYPVSLIIPKIRSGGRKAQRELAFRFSWMGYLGAVIYCIGFKKPAGQLFIYLTYLLSVFILTAVNKFSRVKASGHACSVIWPIITGGYFYKVPGFVIGGAVYAAVLWSSLRLKRHTAGEFLLGTLICIISAGLSALMILY